MIGTIGQITAEVTQDGEVTLEWTAVSNALSYDIFVDGVLLTTVDGAETTYTYNLDARKYVWDNAGRYEYQYKAIDNGGNESAISDAVEVIHLKYVGIPFVNYNQSRWETQNYFISHNQGINYYTESLGYVTKEFSSAALKWNFIRQIIKNLRSQYVTVLSAGDKMYFVNVAQLSLYSRAGAVLTLVFERGAYDETIEIICVNEHRAQIELDYLDMVYNDYFIDDYMEGKTIINVPLDYADIQDAIDAAEANDFIDVSPGTYGAIVCKDLVDIRLQDGAIISSVDNCIDVPEGVTARIFGLGAIHNVNTGDAYPCCVFADTAAQQGSAKLFLCCKELRHDDGRVVAYMQGRLHLKCNSIENNSVTLSCWDWDDSAEVINVDCLSCKSPQNVGIFITYQNYENSLFYMRNTYLESLSNSIFHDSNPSNITVVLANSYFYITATNVTVFSTTDSGMNQRVELYECFFDSAHITMEFYEAITNPKSKLEVTRFSNSFIKGTTASPDIVMQGDSSVYSQTFKLNV